MSAPNPNQNNEGTPPRSKTSNEIQIPAIVRKASNSSSEYPQSSSTPDPDEQTENGKNSKQIKQSILKKTTDVNFKQTEWELIIPTDGHDIPSLSDNHSAHISFQRRKLDCPECCLDSDNPDLLVDLNKSDAGKPDAVNTEFVYYSATLREVAPRLTNDVDRQGIILWLRKLFQPEYHSSRFRSKRNKFLLYLTLTLMNDELYGIFRINPPPGALPDFETLPKPPLVPAEWENDTLWKDLLVGVPRSHERMECTIHVAPCQCGTDTYNGDLLDEEFIYYLYLARPFAALLPNSEDRTKIVAWLQALCTIQSDSCSAMKFTRNDYIVALIGYIHELRIAGPFSEFPGWDPLPPLAEAARIMAESYANIDPCQSNIDDFLATQPVPDEGAFCFLAVTGEMIEANVEEVE